MENIVNTNRSIHENGHKHYNRYIYNLILSNYSVDDIIIIVKKEIRSGIIEK